MKEKFAHWNVLLMQYLKRDWKKILLWIVLLGGFSGGFVPAFVEISKGQGLMGMYETMKNPAMISIVGPTPVKVEDYTVGAMYSHMMLLFCGVFVMIIAALHVVSHTRKEEENGLTEFVCAYRVKRHANSLAIIVEMVLVHTMLALFTGGLMAAFRVESIDTAPSFLFGASVGAAGLTGAVTALIMAQIMSTSTGASGSSLGIIGVLYLLRAGTDIYDMDWSMLNPMGWTYLTFPFTKNRVMPLVYAVIFCTVVVLLSFLLEYSRDFGSGYLPERTGRGKVKKSLLSVPGLFCRLNKTVTISWLIAFACLGGAYGSIYGEMQTFLEGNELIRAMFTMDGVSIEASFTSVIMVIMAGLVSILPVVIVNKLFTEESASRLGQLYAAKVTRGKLYWTTVFIAVIAGAAGLLAGAGGLGAVGTAVMEKSSLDIMDFLTAGMNYFPAVLFITALAALVLGWMPHMGKVLYVYVGYAMMLNYFQGILDFPEWFQKTAVYSWFPRMPMDGFEAAPFFVIAGISLVLMVFGYIGYQRRDLIEQT